MKPSPALLALPLFLACSEGSTLPLIEDGLNPTASQSILATSPPGGLVIYDQGPETGFNNGDCPGNSTYSYVAPWGRVGGQNFSDSFVLPEGGLVGSISIFQCQDGGWIPGPGTVHIKILAAPEGPYLYEEDVLPDFWVQYPGDWTWPTYEVRATLPEPFEALPGVTYWIGLSANEHSMGQYRVQGAVDNIIQVYEERTLRVRDYDIGDQMFRLFGVPGPQTKNDCFKGGWKQFGFKNQGQCVRFVETGKDSRG